MSQKSKKILITGGTGFIGKALCERLLKDGYTLYILTHNRKLKNNNNLGQKNYIHSLSEVENIPMDIVINLAGETIAQRWTESAKNRIYTSRISTTQDIVKFISAQKQPPALLITGSAVGYYGTHNHKIFTEKNTPDITHSEFSSSLCQSWENSVSSLAEREIRTAILRIGPVLEKDGGMLAKLLPIFRLCLGSQTGDGLQSISWIDRDDLIELIVFIIHEQGIDGPVNATSPYPVSNKEFSLALSQALNRPCFLKTPEFLLKFIFGEMAEELMIRGQKVLPEKILSYGFKFSYPKIQDSLLKILQHK